MLDPALSSTVETSAPLWKVSGLDTFCAEIAPVTMIAFTSKQESFLCMADDLGCYLQHYEVAILSSSSFSQEVVKISTPCKSFTAVICNAASYDVDTP
jgi:hypothetical protein